MDTAVPYSLFSPLAGNDESSEVPSATVGDARPKARGSIRYIGSKRRIADEITAHLSGYKASCDRFVDLFAGSGVVGRSAMFDGWSVLANDFLHSSSVVAFAQLISKEQAPFERTGGYDNAIERLNGLRGSLGPVASEYSPSGLSASGHERRYFTVENASKIDSIRNQIRDWRTSGQITRPENDLLLADLLSAASRVANIAGTYGCFLRNWSRSALNPLTMMPRILSSQQSRIQVTCQDAFEVATLESDLVYLDPPYTKRQYAAYYHLAETICVGDFPKVGGVTGLRPWEHKSSPFCYKRRAIGAFQDLVRNLKAKKIAVSYSCQGHVQLAELENLLSKFGQIETRVLGLIGRYTPNKKAVKNGTKVTEYLITLSKR